MNTSKKVAIYLFILLGLVMMAGILLPFITPPISYAHSGKLVFTEEQEYSNFKNWIASDKIEVNDLSILNNNYPIVIKFNVYSNDNESLFGEKVGTNYRMELAYVMFGALFLFAPALILWSKKHDKLHSSTKRHPRRHNQMCHIL